MKGEIIDPKIVPGALIRLNQRTKYVPSVYRDDPKFDIQNTSVPIWQVSTTGPKPSYERIPSGALATVIRRYVDNDVTKLEVLASGKVYHCYGVHADLLE